MQHFEHILVTTDANVLRITINRPEVLNALNEAVHRELSQALDWYVATSALRVAVIKGFSERAFCVDSNLKERHRVGEANTFSGGYAGSLQRFDLFKPVIAAVNGHAIGGGLEIVLACDIAVAVTHAKFGFPEPRVGLVATGGLHRLVRSVPMKHAMEIALGAELFDATQAQSYGLINAVVEPHQLDAEVERRVQAIFAGAPLAVMATKQMMHQGLDAGSLANAFNGDDELLAQALGIPDAQEGPTAFTHKRKPKWQDGKCGSALV